MKETIAEPVLELRLDVGEGPSWDAATRSLIFVDVTPGIVYRFTPESGQLDVYKFGQEVGGAVPTDRGGLVVAARDGVYLADDKASNPVLIADIEADNPGNRMNDVKVDPEGRLWAGTMAFDFAAGAAALYRVAGNQYDRIIPDLTISNGTDWSPDGTLMYYIDSATQRVDVFDYAVADGTVSARRPFVDITGGMPDGMTVDQEGFVWVALFGAGEVRRYSPLGEHVESVRIAASQATSCCFGGADLDTLYITSAAYEFTEEQLEIEPLAGAVFACKPGVKGLASTPFAVS